MMALGASTLFSRNHNTIGVAPQEPYLWESVAGVSRTALGLRYRLLPYLYTLFYKANAAGSPVAQPLWAVFNHDAATHSIDEQFLWGDSVLVSPALYEGQETVTALFPTRQGETATWYSLSDTSAASVVSCPEAGERERGHGHPLVGGERARQERRGAGPARRRRPHHRRGAPHHRRRPRPAVRAARHPRRERRQRRQEGLGWRRRRCGRGNGERVPGRRRAGDAREGDPHGVSTASSLSATVSDATGDGYKGAALSTVATVSVLGVATEPSAATIDASDAALLFTYDADKQLLTIDLSETKVAMNTESTFVEVKSCRE